MKQYFEFIGYGECPLPAVVWTPEQEVKAVLQITHGMTEHMGRYESLAAELCNRGIAVAGFDLRGHGKNPGNPEIASFGEGGWTASVEDMRLFFAELQSRFPGIPHYMLGFSLGSFLLREYLTKYPREGELAGAIIAGTGHQPGWLLSVMMAIVKGAFKKAGFDGTTDLRHLQPEIRTQPHRSRLALQRRQSAGRLSCGSSGSEKHFGRSFLGTVRIHEAIRKRI